VQRANGAKEQRAKLEKAGSSDKVSKEGALCRGEASRASQLWGEKGGQQRLILGGQLGTCCVCVCVCVCVLECIDACANTYTHTHPKHRTPRRPFGSSATPW
jgi:hypothetical protein